MTSNNPVHMKTKLVIFDFDGVLVNTMSFWFGVHKEANPHFTWKQLEEMSHGNFLLGFNNAVKNGHIPPSNWEERYKKELIQHTSFIGGVVSILSEKYILAIVSSSSEIAIKDFLLKENLEHFFEYVLGWETDKSKAIKLYTILKKYSVDSSDAVFITDTLGDVLEAHEVGIRTIGETWGLHDRETLERGKPEIIIDDPSELEETVRKLLH